MTTARYALLTDGSTVQIRPAGPADAEAVRAMHTALSPDNQYLRFFSMSPRNADREARRVSREPGQDHVALLAWLGDRLVGVASYEPTRTPGVAEVAFAVPDDMHGRGIATLLLEHLVSAGRERGLRAFRAAALLENRPMLGVFADAGLPVHRETADGVVQLTFPIPAGADGHDSGYLDTVAARESRADVASLRPLLTPASVAVVGASRRPGTVGLAILRNLVTGGFTGKVYPVNPRATSLFGLPCLASVDDLPQRVDLAVLAVPAADVVDVAERCGRRGVRSLVVITSGLGERGPDLLAACRRHGMRLVGPHCFGVAVPPLGLDATFAARHPAPGAAGVVVQSGGIGASLLGHLSRLGIGVSSFASVGDKYDVSSNDMLTWWEQDGETRLAILYVESFGSPRKFARTARRVGQRMPVMTVIGGRSTAGQAAAASHTAAAATPLVTQEALFGQAGIIAVPGLGELVEVAALLAAQPLPAGDRVAIVTNAGGAGVLAADSCADHGLRVPVLGPATRQRLAALLPPGAVVTNPVDTTAAVSPDAFRACLEQVAADDGVDAVLAVIVRTALVSPGPALRAARVAKPLAAAVLDQRETVRMLPRDERQGGRAVVPAAIPGYAFPEGAARALGHAVRYQAWRGRQRGQVPEFPGLRVTAAKSCVAAFLREHPDGGWLPSHAVRELLDCYQIPVAPATLASQGPTARPGTPAAPPRPGAVEVRVGVVQEPVFGPLVVFGLGGPATEVLGDRAARLTPLTGADADDLIHGVHAAPLLFGHRGSAPVDTAALKGLLLRVSRLADDLPEVAELDLHPVVATPEGAQVADGRIRVSPARSRDPFLRQLR
jgi:acyl-CoA synthetase (NDP forming)/GNAT superfamily N-acetyltransferase